MKCPNCGTENVTGARFCATCGTVVGVPVSSDSGVGGMSRRCPFCGQTMSEGAVFCSGCGRSTMALSAQAPQAPHAGSVVTLGRRFIALGLVTIGLYFLWWGIYSAYYGTRYGWDEWLGVDYADMILSFLVGVIVVTTGLVSLVKR